MLGAADPDPVGPDKVVYHLNSFYVHTTPVRRFLAAVAAVGYLVRSTPESVLLAGRAAAGHPGFQVVLAVGRAAKIAAGGDGHHRTPRH